MSTLMRRMSATSADLCRDTRYYMIFDGRLLAPHKWDEYLYYFGDRAFDIREVRKVLGERPYSDADRHNTLRSRFYAVMRELIVMLGRKDLMSVIEQAESIRDEELHLQSLAGVADTEA